MQALADLLTIQQKVGKEQKVKLAFVGDANNVAFSLFEILLLFGHEVTWAGPEEYSFSSERKRYLSELAEKYGGKISLLNEAETAVQNADVIYADTFVSMGEEGVYQQKLDAFKNFQVNAELFSHAKKEAGFLHCLPAHRGIEVTDEIMDSKNSWIFDQAENRMTTSKGLFATLLA